MDLGEAELLRRARGGDQAACREIVERFGPGLLRLARSLVGQPADAEDVVQETLSAAFRTLRSFEERASIKTWLSRILLRQAARSHRARYRREAGALDLTGQAEPAAPAADGSADIGIDVRSALAELSTEHREVLVLREYQGLSYTEIAEVLGVPMGTVESRIHRARQELKARLRDYLP